MLIRNNLEERELERRDSSASGHSNSSINQESTPSNPAPDTVSLSRISIRSFDSNQSYETSSIVSASEIRKRLQTATEKDRSLNNLFK